MRIELLLTLLLAAPLAGGAEQQATPARKPVARTPATKPSAPGPLASEQEKVVYAIGLSIWRSLSPLDLGPSEVAIIQRAIGDAAAGKPEVSLEEYGRKLDAFGRERAQRVVEREKARSQAFLDKVATEPGAIRTGSGLVFLDVRPGTGASPSAKDTVKVHYRGTLVDGTEFDSSYKRGEPARFALGSVIRCWTEGVQKIRVGGKARLVCPADIAYGDRGRPSIPGGAALVFEIELLDIATPEIGVPQAPATPPAPPS